MTNGEFLQLSKRLDELHADVRELREDVSEMREEMAQGRGRDSAIMDWERKRDNWHTRAFETASVVLAVVTVLVLAGVIRF